MHAPLSTVIPGFFDGSADFGGMPAVGVSFLAATPPFFARTAEAPA